MKRHWKGLWIEALLSGDYVQGLGRLRTDVAGRSYWCCLGVLGNLLQADAWASQPQGEMALDGHATFLTEALAAKAGLTGWQQQTLARLNDSGYSFAQMARVIQSYIPDDDADREAADYALARMPVDPAQLMKVHKLSLAFLAPVPKWLTDLAAGPTLPQEDTVT